MAKSSTNILAFEPPPTGRRSRKAAGKFDQPYGQLIQFMKAMQAQIVYSDDPGALARLRAEAIAITDQLIRAADELLRIRAQTGRTGMELARVMAQRDYAIIEKNRATAERDAAKQELLESYICKTTGILRRDAGNRMIPLLVDTAARENEDVFICVIDIDHFKKFNDKFGHKTGDEVLHDVAQAIKNSVRRSDLTIRWGGEEIIVVGATKKKGMKSAMAMVAEQVRVAVEGITSHEVTVSIGVYAFDPQTSMNFLDAFHQADLALYAAKRDGRNCVRIMDKDTVKPLLPPKPRANAKAAGIDHR